MDLAGWGLLIVAVALIIVLSIYFRKVKPDQADDGSSMPPVSRRVLVTYLLVLGLALVYSLVEVSSAQFPAGNLVGESLTAGAPTPTPTPSATPAPPPGTTQTLTPTPPGTTAGTTTTSAAPILDGVFPQSDPNNPFVLQVIVYGRNFAKESSVRFNRDTAATKTIVAGTMLQAPLDEVHSSTGYVAVDVIGSDNTPSNSLVVKVGKPTATISLFGWHPRITQELQLLLLALLAGAIGSYVHAIKSLGDFIGNRTLTASWFWWYIIRPFLGMAMALIFYGVLRGGFLAGTPADAKVVNPFGVIAVGALVGMFADKAAQKLADIFDTLFQSPDQRGGKLAAPVINKLDPDTMKVGQTQLGLRIIGDRLGSVSKVSINQEERKPEQVSEQLITLTLKPEDVAAPSNISVAVIDPNAGASPAATLYVTDLAITTPSLANAVVGQEYNQQLAASGGTAPCKWSLVSPPDWLKVNEDTGVLSGKPNAATTSNMTVKVTDKSGAAVTKAFSLTVNPAG